MSAHADLVTLLEPIGDASPCGDDVEYTLLPALDATRVFGQKTGIGSAPDWGQIRALALDALPQSKDLRLLAYLSAALVRTDGLHAFVQTLTLASEWLTTYWDHVYPRVDEDALIRRNALNCLADPAAIVDPLRRLPLVSHRQHGHVSLRDVEIANGQQVPAEGDARLDAGQVSAAFAAVPVGELVALQEAAAGAIAALKRIEGTMASEGGPDVVPTFDALSGTLAKIERLLRTQLASRPDAPAAVSDLAAESAASGGPVAVAAPGTIRSRDDAIVALDAVADFFRRHEPSSPVPLLIERAKRLVSKNFLEVLADIAPEALAQARAAGGISEAE